MNEEGKRRLMDTCREMDCRLQTKQVGDDLQYWVQSNCTSSDRGGKVWTKEEDGGTWMSLGGNRMSSVCAHIVQ
eukprot:6766120-Karenia_brevis.AAC.1